MSKKKNLSPFEMLEKLTGRKWKFIDGPDSRCGVDYWLKSGKHEANVNIDQDWTTIAVDGETIFKGTFEWDSEKEIA